MTEKIREYNVNGAIIIGVDNGYGNMKTARRCFKTALTMYDAEPVLSRDYLEYEGKFYVIGEGHKGFVADKQSDEDNYILTLSAIAKELEARGMKDAVNTARVHLAVGLPLKWVQAQKEDFRKYLMRNRMVEVRYKNRLYRLEFVGCTVMPQCYSAVAENLKEFKGITLLADIGNGTMNLMYLNNGRPMESKSWTEKLGVFQCYQKIHNLIQDTTGDCLMAEVVESFLRTGETDLPEKYAKLMKQGATEYTEVIMQKLRDHEFNEELMRVYFMGGGARLVEQFGKYNPERTIFNHDIKDSNEDFENIVLGKEICDVLSEDTENVLLNLMLNEYGHIAIGINVSDIPFITSDTPVLVLPNIWDNSKSEMMMYYPITPKRCIFFLKRKTIEKQDSSVIADFKTGKLIIRDIFDIPQEAYRREKEIDKMRNPKTIELERGDVLICNSYCAKMATRYIVSSQSIKQVKLWETEEV